MTNTEAKQAATLRDVAALAGVDKATVSTVLNGGRSTARVSTATRERILAAATELQYVPNEMARGLKTVRFRSLGLVYNYANPAWIAGDEYGIALLSGIISKASSLEYNVTNFHKTWHDSEKHAAAGFRGQGIDGFIAIAPLVGSQIVAGLTELNIPLVVVSAVPDVPDVPHVILDNRRAIRLAVDHLLGLGHRRIAYITSNGAKQFDIMSRENAFVEMMAEAGGTVRPEYLVDTDNGPGGIRQWDSPENGFAADSAFYQAERLLRLTDPPTAVITAAPEQTLFAARACGLRVPEDLSIIGLNETTGARFVSPAITTIRQPLPAMGECAAQLLITLVESKPIAAQEHVFQPELVIRHSTGRLSG